MEKTLKFLEGGNNVIDVTSNELFHGFPECAGRKQTELKAEFENRREQKAL